MLVFFGACFRSAAMAVHFHLFGAPKVGLDGEIFVLSFERRSQLLAFLALKRGWVSRAELASMFWPDQAAKLAYANLRKILFRLQALPYARGIELDGGAVRCVATTDVSVFEEALRERRIADALQVRSGEFLAGFDDGHSEAWTSWLGFERERLRAMWRGAILERVADEIEPELGIDLSLRLLDADPLDEAALRAHMLWLARHGQAARARQAYQAFVARLAADLGLAPGAELKALHDSLGKASASPVAIATAATATPDESFVGRAVELRRIAGLLAQDECRLVSVVGPGGVGKTRFAQRVSQDLAARFPDGVVFIPLEDVPAHAELGSRLARELGIAVAGGADPFSKVSTFLTGRRALLVLDNFEHLAAAAALLEELLRACPLLKVIVTSRVRLALSSEWLLRLDGLPCPEPDDQDHFETFDAARLFIKAARRTDPELVPGEAAAAIVEICRQVEGMPLALELAAAWTRVFSCEAIAAELRRGNELLSAADPAYPERHASIDAVFEQSWRLLTPIERDVLARLSVFRGGFTAEAARAVASAAPPVLGALADKSLLRKEDARVHLHSLVHQFASARLGDEARSSTEAVHAKWFGGLMTQLRQAVESGDRDAMRRMDAEFENCRAAWQWAVARGATDVLIQCKPALFNYCDHRCRFDEALLLVQAALDSAGVRTDAALEARLLARTAHLEYRLDRYAAAEATGRQALDVARTARDYAAKSLCLNVLGSCCLRVGRYEDALRHFRQGLQGARAHNDLHNAAATLDHIALVLKWLGRYDEALRMSLESLVAHRRLGDVAGEALCLNNLASQHLARQDYAAAEAYLRESLVLCDRDGLVATRMYVLANLTEVALKRRDNAAAEGYARRAIDIAMAVGNRPVQAWMKLQFARFALARGDTCRCA